MASHDLSLSSDTISGLLHALGGIPDYVRKLERQKIAADKSNDAKAKRIHDLEAEVERCVIRLPFGRYRLTELL